MYVYVGTNDNELIVFNVVDRDNDGRRNNQQRPSKKEEQQRISPLIIDPLPSSSSEEGGKTLMTSIAGVVSAIVKHPKYPLLYVFSSFDSYHQGIITTFKITSPNGILERIDQDQRVLTGGYNVSHVTVSPTNTDDGSNTNIIMCVVHANDGNMSFFDISDPNGVLQPHPPIILQTPELRPETRTNEPPYCLPSLSHASYHVIKENSTTSSSSMVLVASDTSSQGRLWVYAVDKQGIPMVDSKLNSNQPQIIQQHKCHIVGSPLSSFRVRQAMVMPPIRPKKYTIRQTILHPNGKFAYILLDSHAVIHVYEIYVGTTTTTTTIEGERVPVIRLGGDCLQELALPVPPKSIHCGATKMLITTDGQELLVSNCSSKVWGKDKKETWIQRYQIQNDGERLVMKKYDDDTANNNALNNIIPISGWVNQFELLQDGDASSDKQRLIVGVTDRGISSSSSSSPTSETSSSSGIDILEKQGCNSDDKYEKIHRIDLWAKENDEPVSPSVTTSTGEIKLSCFAVVEDGDVLA